MNIEDSDRNQSSRHGDLGSVSTRINGSSRRSRNGIPLFSHNTIDLKKKNAIGFNGLPNFQVPNFSEFHRNHFEHSRTNQNSLNNLSLIASSRTSRIPVRNFKAYYPSGIQPKVLNRSHDEDLPNPGPETEGDLSVIVNNTSIREIRLDFDETGNRNPLSQSQRRGELGEDSRVQLINQSVNQQNVNMNNSNIPNHSSEQLQNSNDTNAPENNSRALAISSEKAEDWQHELTVKANHKFVIIQWSLIFITLASLMAYASLIGETPPNVLYIILILIILLHIYSILRFFRLKLHWKKKLNKALKLADWVILTVYSLGSFLKTYNNDLNLIIFFFPVPVVILPRIIFFRKQTSFFRIALWAQLFLLTLRIDEIINFSWYLVFIIGFGLCAVFIGRICHLGIRIHKKKKLLKELPEEVHFRLIRIKILGIIYNLLMSGYSLIFILFFFGLAQRLETGENSVVLGVTLILTMIYSVLLIYISLKYKYEITRSIISKIIQNDPDHIKIKEILRKELEVGITRKSAPRYLVKMSPTYYQVAKPVKSKLEKKLTKINFVTVGDIDAKKEEDEEDNEQEDQKENSQQQCDNESKSNEVSKSEEEEKSKDDESDIQEDEAQHEEEEDKSQVKDQDDDNCFICCEKKPNSVIMECGHGGVCYQCGLEMWKKEEKCYLCRQKITRLLKLEDIEEDNDLAKVQVAITFNKNKQININESFQDVLNDI